MIIFLIILQKYQRKKCGVASPPALFSKKPNTTKLFSLAHLLVSLGKKKLIAVKVSASKFMRIASICILLVATSVCVVESIPVFATTASEYRSLGLADRNSERYTEAIAFLKKSVQLEPKNLSGRVMLGWTQHLAGQEDAAAVSLIQVLSYDPTWVPALNALGIVYLVSGKLNSAVAVHAWAAFLEPKNEVAYYNLSLAFHRLQIYDSAILTAKKAATLEPNNPHPLVALAIAYWDSGDRAQAKLAYRQAQSLDFRYSSVAFLNHLKKAGFSSSQIDTTKQILFAQT